MMKYDLKYIFRRVLTFFIIFVLLSFFKSCEVHAATYNMPYQDIHLDNSTWFSNYGYYGTTITTSGTSINFDIFMNESSYSFGADQATAIIADVCVSASLQDVTRSYGYGSSCPNSCFTQNPYFVDLHATCKYNNNNSGYMWRIYLPVLKWNYGAGCGQTGCHPTLNDSITFKSKNYNGSIMFQNIYITDEVIGTDYNSSFDTINSQILAAQNQAHTDSQNTQNAINDAKNQAHQDAQQAHQDAQQAHQDSQDINNSINNSNTSSSENQLSGIFSNSAFNDSSGIQNIIELPLNFIRGLGSSCQSISLTIPYINSNVNLPCIKQELTNRVPTIVNILSITINGFIVYRLLIEIVSLIKSARNPEDDRLEVLDL